jgi:hypothetical protein
VPDLHVVEQLQDYLVAQGVGQMPHLGPSITVPSIVAEPPEGAPEPRVGESATITITDTTLAPAASLEAWIEEAFIDVVVRSREASAGKLIHRTIRGLIHPNDAHGGRKMWTMGELLVEYSTIWTGEQPVDSDEVSYRRKAGYRFGVRRKALAGLPYAS